MTPLHLKLLRRGESCRYIGLCDDMVFRHSEMAALNELRNMGYAELDNGQARPGPRAPSSWMITEAGRKALRRTTRKVTA